MKKREYKVENGEYPAYVLPNGHIVILVDGETFVIDKLVKRAGELENIHTQANQPGNE